jgi:hypothetical protein
MENNTQEQLTYLLERVSNLEKIGFEFYLPLVISSLALGITIYHFILKRRYETFDRIENNIDNARVYLFQTVFELSKNKDIDGEIKLKIINTAQEHLNNKFDDACRKYNKCRIDRKEFRHKYHQAIVEIVNNNKDLFNSNLTKYVNILEYYQKEHQQK